MRLLIDTHTFIWYIGDGAKLPSDIRHIIAADDTDVVMSIVSLWEISIKVALGRLDIEGGFENLPAVDIREGVVFAQEILSREGRNQKDRINYGSFRKI